LFSHTSHRSRDGVARAPDFVAGQLLPEVLHLLAARLQRRRDLLLRAAAAVAQLPPAGRLPPVAENPASLCS